MIDKHSFANFNGKKIEKLYLIMWPPFGEDKLLDIDLTFGFKFEKEDVFITSICIDKIDLWTPIVKWVTPEYIYEGTLFYKRLEMWMLMESLTDENFSYEIYDVSSMSCFSNIVLEPILEVQLMSLETEKESTPFGIKFYFEKDYIMFFPNSTGTTIETIGFNQNENLSFFQAMGRIRLINLSNATL